MSSASAIAEIREALNSGELFKAYDLAQQALETRPDDLEIRYLAVLTLARAGAQEQAMERFQALGLHAASDQEAPRQLKIDIASLHGRLVKDMALSEVDPAKRLPLLKSAAHAYENVYKDTRDRYPGINAATLFLLSGQGERASRLATEILEDCERHQPKAGDDTYYLDATRAEAALVLGCEREAAAALEHAAGVRPRNYGAMATTRRQLRLVCQKRGLDLGILKALRIPRVFHFVSSRNHLPPHAGAEEELRAQVSAHLDKSDAGFGYGSLSSWADVLVAESLFSRGAELQFVLPFAAEEVRRLAFDPLGGNWSNRFDACLARAEGSPTVMTEEYLHDDHVFVYANEVAMGLAMLRSQFLGTEICQLAICSDSDRAQALGAETGWDISLARHVIDPGTAPRTESGRPSSAPTPARRLAAILFGDMKGFSKLRESQIPTFVNEVMGRIAAVVEGYAQRILFRNTWGDGLYIVISEVSGAACLATDLQAALRDVDRTALGLPADLDLRLGLHAGPVFEVNDPVLGCLSFMGSHVSRTARIEPVTPPGQVYVSEPFAARVALQPKLGFECEYIGQVPAAKDFGKMRMYALKRKRWAI